MQKQLIQTLKSSLEDAKEALPKQKQRLSRLQLDYGPQETNLRNRKTFLKGLKAQAEKSQIRSDQVQFRKVEIECSNLKSELLKQSLETFELDWAVRDHDMKVESETLELQKAIKMLEAEEALVEYKQHHQVAQRNWVGKWGAQSEITEEAVILRASLNTAKFTIQRQDEEIETLKNAAKLRPSRTDLPSGLQKNDEVTDLAFYNCSLAIRGRKYEWDIMTKQDVLKIQNGNSVAHHGCPAIDAYLLTTGALDPSKYLSLFHKYYGPFTPQIVWAGRKCKNFMSMLSSRCGMTEFKGRPYPAYETTKFSQLFNMVLSKIKDKSGAEIDKFLSEDANGAKLFGVMETEFQTALVAHNNYRRR